MSQFNRRRWLRPQAVPRGFLRLYVLSLLARGQEVGYSIMQTIDEKTDGAWHPGPGTIYPMLKWMEKEALIKPVTQRSVGGRVAYSITEKGRSDLEEMRHKLVGARGKERVMVRLFADLLPPNVFAPEYVRRNREMFQVFQEVVAKVSPSEREGTMKELRASLEAQLSWLDAQLSQKIRTKSER